MGCLTLTADMCIQISGEMALRIRRGERLVHVQRVPKTMFAEVHERQSQDNHQQTLERIRERNGFDAIEMLAIFAMLPFEAVEKLSEETAHRLLYAMISTHNGGMRIAEKLASSPSIGRGGL